ncbi:hypothetical protein HAX54_013327 [Datura stramonium]|uniref:Uncharacterized protein n=1 Tax=Datura stramonium TaxID=4076 RepID=A0ABS8RIL9_DATST|nr:hypothetical protein [Datura stramonium]
MELAKRSPKRGYLSLWSSPREDKTLLYHQQKCLLIAEVTNPEIKEVVQAMPHDEAPGVDGFPVEFFIGTLFRKRSS